MLDFTARTWGDDGDYIGEVWDTWLGEAGVGEAGGVTLVAELGGQPVALVHVRMLSEDESWIEGVRVDPRIRRQGVGRVLISRALIAARERGATVARLFTDAENVASQALFARFGFVRVAELVRYAADALKLDAAAEVPALATPGEADFERVWAWLVQSNLAPFNGGLEIADWTARAVTEPRLRAYLSAGQVVTHDAWEIIQALAIVPREAEYWAQGQGTPPLLVTRYVDGQADGIGRLALALRRRAAELGCAGVRLWLPDLLILRDAMDGAGYSDRGHGALYVYARDL